MCNIEPVCYQHKIVLPVSMASVFALIHSGTDSPTRKANPIMNRLREEFRSTYCRFEIPTATIKPGRIRPKNVNDYFLWVLGIDPEDL